MLIGYEVPHRGTETHNAQMRKITQEKQHLLVNQEIFVQELQFLVNI